MKVVDSISDFFKTTTGIITGSSLIITMVISAGIKISEHAVDKYIQAQNKGKVEYKIDELLKSDSINKILYNDLLGLYRGLQDSVNKSLDLGRLNNDYLKRHLSKHKEDKEIIDMLQELINKQNKRSSEQYNPKIIINPIR